MASKQKKRKLDNSLKEKAGPTLRSSVKKQKLIIEASDLQSSLYERPIIQALNADKNLKIDAWKEVAVELNVDGNIITSGLAIDKL